MESRLAVLETPKYFVSTALNYTKERTLADAL